MKFSLLAKLAKGVINKIKSFDNYGKAITFTYKGEEQFQTFIGGVFSIIAFTILIAYSQLMVRIMLGRNDTNKSISKSVSNLYNDINELKLENTTFDFAFQFSSLSYTDLLNPDYFDLTLTQYKYVQDPNGTWQPVTESIEFEECTNDKFRYSNKEQLTQINFSSYICPKTKDFRVMGDSFSSRYTYFELNLSKCSDSETCKSEDEINSLLSGNVLDMAVINTYFDFEDYSNPLKTYIDDRFLYGMLTNFSKQYLVYIRENKAETIDDYFNYSPNGDESGFVSIERIDQDIHESSSIVNIRFIKDPTSDTYERSVFSLLDALGNIGGVNEVLQVSCGMIISIFSGRMFLYSIISSLYQVDSMNKNRRNPLDVLAEGGSDIDISQAQENEVGPISSERVQSIESRVNRPWLNLRNLFDLFRTHNKSNNVTEEEFEKRNSVFSTT